MIRHSTSLNLTTSRRGFIKSTFAGSLAASVRLPAAEKHRPAPELARHIGVTTGSFMQHLRLDPKLRTTFMLDFPQRMREQLGLKVIDIMSETLASFEPAYLDQVRARAEKHGCIITNLKMNQEAADLGSPDPEVRRSSQQVYRKSIDAAQRLGCRWVRPPLRTPKPNPQIVAAGFRELIDYAAPKGISLLVENHAGMRNDPNAVATLIKAIGKEVDAQPDIGGFTDETRDAGIRSSFRFAVSCDFKAFQLTPKGEHTLYDLKRCFELAWETGFRGPWCIEHFNESLEGLWQGFGQVTEMLRKWMPAV